MSFFREQLAKFGMNLPKKKLLIVFKIIPKKRSIEEIQKEYAAKGYLEYSSKELKTVYIEPTEDDIKKKNKEKQKREFRKLQQLSTQQILEEVEELESNMSPSSSYMKSVMSTGKVNGDRYFLLLKELWIRDPWTHRF